MPTLSSLPAPRIFLDWFVLPNALPGTAQLILGTTVAPEGGVCGFASGAGGFSDLRGIELSCAVDASFTIHKVPAGGTAVAANRMCIGTLMEAGDIIHINWDPLQHKAPPAYSYFFFASVADAIYASVLGADYSS